MKDYPLNERATNEGTSDGKRREGWKTKMETEMSN